MTKNKGKEKKPRHSSSLKRNRSRSQHVKGVMVADKAVIHLHLVHTFISFPLHSLLTIQFLSCYSVIFSRSQVRILFIARAGTEVRFVENGNPQKIYHPLLFCRNDPRLHKEIGMAVRETANACGKWRCDGAKRLPASGIQGGKKNQFGSLSIPIAFGKMRLIIASVRIQP